jgi:hypothetical protein
MEPFVSVGASLSALPVGLGAGLVREHVERKLVNERASITRKKVRRMGPSCR